MQGAKSVVGSSRGRQDLVRGGFGDEAVLEEGVVNPNYDEERYGNYSETTRKNLVRSRMFVDVMDVVVIFVGYDRVLVLVLV